MQIVPFTSTTLRGLCSKTSCTNEIQKHMKSKTSMQYLIAVCCASHYIFAHNNYLVCINIKGSYGMIILFVNDDPVFGCQDSLCGFTAQFIRCFCTICFFLVVGTAKVSSSTVYSLQNIEQFS